MIAQIGDEQRCRLSIMSQIWSKPELKFVIPGKAFVPKPNVDVGVVTMLPLKQPLTNLPFDLVEKVMRHIFSMRQKYCRRGIETLYPPPVQEEFTARTFAMAQVDPEMRPFELSVEECLSLAESYNKIIEEHPTYAEYNHRAPKNELLQFM